MREFILYQEDDGTWVAETKQLPGVRMRGKTGEEAVEKLKNALKLYFPCDH